MASSLLLAGCVTRQAVIDRPNATPVPSRNGAAAADSYSVTRPLTVLIAWDYVSASNIVFRLYSTNDLRIPKRQWPCIAIIPGNSRSYAIQLTARERFFVLTASNTVSHLESGYATR